MTFAEAMGQVSDRFGRRMRVTISGRSERGPALAADVVGVLAPGWDQDQLSAAQANLPEDTVHAFGFEDAPHIRLYFSPEEFRHASVNGDQLIIHTGENVDIAFEPGDRAEH